MGLRRGTNKKPIQGKTVSKHKGRPTEDKGLLDGIENVLKESKATQGLGEYRRIPVRAVERDPKQPRDDLPTVEQVIACREHGIEAVPEELRTTMERLITLAKSIDSGELLHAIKVINISDENGERYRIRTGERRYLAHVYLNEPLIIAIIHSTDAVSDADAIYFEQLVENIQRQDLSLAQRFRGLQYFSAFDEEKGISLNMLTPEDIQGILGVKKSQAYKYRKVLNEASSVLIEAINTGKVTTIEAAYDLMVIPEQQRDTQIAAIVQGATAPSIQKDVPAEVGLETVTENTQDNPNAAPKSTTKKVGRNKEKVNLGATSKAGVIRVLIEALSNKNESALSAHDLEATDWDDLKEVEQMWKEVLKALEAAHG